MDILKQVREIPRPRTSPETRHSTKPSGLSTFLEDLGNRFASLDVYEPSEEFLNAPAIARPTPTQGGNVTYEAETLTSLEDAIFAYAIMSNDLDKIRAHVGWIWQNYRRGAFDLAAAAVATNTACDLARSLTEEVAPICKDHGGVVKVANFYYLNMCMQKGHSSVSSTEAPCSCNH